MKISYLSYLLKIFLTNIKLNIIIIGKFPKKVSIMTTQDCVKNLLRFEKDNIKILSFQWSENVLTNKQLKLIDILKNAPINYKNFCTGLFIKVLVNIIVEEDRPVCRVCCPRHQHTVLGRVIIVQILEHYFGPIFSVQPWTLLFF